MRVGVMTFLALMSLGPATTLAQSPPIDLRTVSAGRAQQQLQELAAVLERYDPYLKTQGERARFNARVRHLAGTVHGPIPAWRDWLLQEKLMRALNDPHAELDANTLENRALDVVFQWVSNGLLVSPAPWMHPALFPRNSEVVRIGGETPGEILPRLEALYAGTPGWVADWAGSMLRYAFELRWLGLLHGEKPVMLTLRTPSGHVKRLPLPIAPLPDSKALMSAGRRKPWFSWFVDKRHNIGWFTLNSMKLAGPYEHAVARFFAAVEKAGITRVAVDLRKNSGGESLAEAPFMQYLGVSRVMDYSTPTYFGPAPLRTEVHQLVRGLKRLGYGPDLYTIPVPPQPPADRIFKGRFFVVTGPGTFSSAMNFAADVKFNHLGTIVGLPCGEVLTGGGNVKWFAHPASGVPFQVPTDIFSWPGMPANALVKPDVWIPLTVHDVQHGVDPVRQWFDAHTSNGDAS